MTTTHRRFASILTLLSIVAVTAAAQALKFPTGVIKGSDGTNTIALDFDTTGVITAYVNDQAFSNGSYEAKGDTIKFGTVNGPEGYSCATGGTYLWKFAENRMTFTRVTDDCEMRAGTLTSITWTRG